jgi:hypothetical protein
MYSHKKKIINNPYQKVIKNKNKIKMVFFIKSKYYNILIITLILIK